MEFGSINNFFNFFSEKRNCAIDKEAKVGTSSLRISISLGPCPNFSNLFLYPGLVLEVPEESSLLCLCPFTKLFAAQLLLTIDIN